MLPFQFELYRIAVISTGHITRADSEAIASRDFPGHVAELDGVCGAADVPGSILAVPGIELLDERVEEYGARGMSSGFILLISQASRQGIGYVRFDRDGAAVGGAARFDW